MNNGLYAFFNFKFEDELTIRHRHRHHSQKDIGKLQECFSRYCSNEGNYSEPTANYNREKFLEKLEEVAKKCDKSDSEFLILCISSHGGEGSFDTAGGGIVKEYEVFEKFADLPIPKLFLFQFCRGNTRDPGDGPNSASTDQAVNSIQNELAYNTNHRMLIDRLPRNSVVAYSTAPDRTSRIGPGGGMWEAGGLFISAFKMAFEELESTGDDVEVNLMAVLTLTNNILSTHEYKHSIEKNGVEKAYKVKYVAQFASTMERDFIFKRNSIQSSASAVELLDKKKKKKKKEKTM